MKTQHKRCQSAVEQPIAAMQRLRHSYPTKMKLFITIALLPGCEVYDSSLMNKWPDVNSSQHSRAEDSATDDKKHDFEAAKGDAGNRGDNSDISSIEEYVAEVCIPNAVGDSNCPFICTEICDGQDNDCDGYTDETEANQKCELPNATSECFEGTCIVVECVDHFGNCDDDDENGCETSLGTNADCGHCGDTCYELPDSNYPNAMEGECVDDKCTILECEEDFADCNNLYDDGCEEDLTSSASHCGSCSVDCNALSHVDITVCQDSVCVIDSCTVGYKDCNAEAEDGCEHELKSLVPPEEECVLETHDGQAYYFCNTTVTWSEAHDQCAGSCMDLVRIGDEEENRFVNSNILNNYWIGANDHNSEGEWVWTQGATPFWNNDQESESLLSLLRNDTDSDQDGTVYSNWALGEPNDGDDSDCALISTEISGRWFDWTCSSLFGYVCEQDFFDLESFCDSCNSPGPCETATGAICDENGTCAYPADIDNPCDDGNPCTHTDICQIDKSCVGIPYSCSNPGICETIVGAICEGDGTCIYPANEGGRCDDNNSCTHTDRCSADKSCSGSPYVCDSPGPCETAVGAQCKGDGTCLYPANVGLRCDDDNPCTFSDRCQPDKSCSGTIVVGARCEDGNDCTDDDTCEDSGECVGTPIDECNDGDSCCPEGCSSIRDDDC